MATVKVWALKGNVQNAVNYIVDEKKAKDGYIESKDTRIGTAKIDWELQGLDQRRGPSSYNETVGFHFLMSFPPDSITVDEAFELSKEWIEQCTNGEHQYVMAVHQDKNHLHTHFIVNSKNNVDNKKMQIVFKRDLKRFKEIADKICFDAGHPVLEQPKGKGMSYYEWSQKQKGDSIKDVVRKVLDYTIPRVREFADLKAYLTKLGYKVEAEFVDNSNVKDYFTVNKDRMVRVEFSNNHEYSVRIPKSDNHIFIPSDTTELIHKEKTLKFTIDENIAYQVFDKNNEFKTLISGRELKNSFEKLSVKKSNSLKITVPTSKKAIRTKNLQLNEYGQGYSLDEILKRISENECYIKSSQDILDVIGENLDGKQRNEKLKTLYSNANIKTKWKSSEYYSMSRKERYVNFKMESIQESLNRSMQLRAEVNAVTNLGAYQNKQQELLHNLSDVRSALSKQEDIYQTVQEKRFTNELEITTQELDDFVAENIVPLQRSKLSVSQELAEVNKKISTANQILAKQKTKTKDISR